MAILGGGHNQMDEGAEKEQEESGMTFTLPVNEVLAMLRADRVNRESDEAFAKRMGLSPPRRGKTA